jgi:hypothetical protein
MQSENSKKLIFFQDSLTKEMDSAAEPWKKESDPQPHDPVPQEMTKKYIGQKHF